MRGLSLQDRGLWWGEEGCGVGTVVPVDPVVVSFVQLSELSQGWGDCGWHI